MEIISLYNQLLAESLPPDYQPTSSTQIISDLIHLQHPIFKPYNSLLIDKLQSPANSTTINSRPAATATASSFLSPRKHYEVQTFTQYICRSSLCDVEYVIEFGSGKSYLSRELVKAGYKVICIEINNDRIKTSKRLDSLLNQQHNPILYLNSGLQEVDKIRHFVDCTKNNNCDLTPKCLLIGLDSCGETLPRMIMDALIEGVQGLDVVGCSFIPCCFHKVEGLQTYSDGKFINRACSQDLRFLANNEDIIEHYFVTEDEDEEDFNMERFKLWCFERAKALFSEFVIMKDREEYLRGVPQVAEVFIETVFDFKISSRNLVITCVKNK